MFPLDDCDRKVGALFRSVKALPGQCLLPVWSKHDFAGGGELNVSGCGEFRVEGWSRWTGRGGEWGEGETDQASFPRCLEMQSSN